MRQQEGEREREMQSGTGFVGKNKHRSRKSNVRERAGEGERERERERELGCVLRQYHAASLLIYPSMDAKQAGDAPPASHCWFVWERRAGTP